MKTGLLSKIKDPKRNGGYTNTHDDGVAVERTLLLTDDSGNTVRIKNEQIGQLLDEIKPY